MSDGTDDSTGYGRPPKASRFKKGQSGNPRGRRKGSKSVESVFAKALRERVTVVEKGKRRSITKLEAAFTQIANRSAAGDERFVSKLLNNLKLIEKATLPEEKSSDSMSTADREVLAAILARMAAVEGGDDDQTK
jgi:hypothetical protein